MHPAADRRARRHFVQATGAAALAAALGSGAARAQAERRYAVVSLIGDELVVVYVGLQTGTLLDPNRSRTVADPTGTMDRYALDAAGRALQAGGAPAATLLTLPPSPLHAQAERWGDDKTVSLPGPLVDALTQSGASHLVLLTKHRADASIPLLDSRKGTGKLRGLGFYVDTHSRIRMVESGATETGLLATYAYFTLTLADARTGVVLNQRHRAAARPYPLAASKTAMDPWDVLKPEEKVARLRGLLQSELAREVPLLIAG
jgi:hypothetical protein